jgi:hypothetical protein
MSHLLNFNNWLRVNEDATTTTTKPGNEAPNFWFSKLEKIVSSSEICFKFSYAEKDKVYNSLEMSTGLANRERQLLEIAIPLKGVYDYYTLNQYLKDGTCGYPKSDFDITKTTQQLMNPVTFGIRNGSGPLAKKTPAQVIYHLSNIPAYGKTQSGKPWGTQYGDAKYVWNLMLYMMVKAGLGKSPSAA